MITFLNFYLTQDNVTLLTGGGVLFWYPFFYAAMEQYEVLDVIEYMKMNKLTN
jgi:hypothetical protein